MFTAPVQGRGIDAADELADERASELGVPRSLLSTPPEQMADEFRHAERRVIKSIRHGTIQQELPTLAIPDVVGMKLIVDDPEFIRLRAALQASGTCEVIEEEHHSGNYNAVNLRIGFRLPRAWLVDQVPSGRFLHLFNFRGLQPDRVRLLYPEFLASAEETVQVEIIVSSFQEFLESEIGRGMHEERILSQRAHPDYTGHLATNVRYLLDFILGLCRGPAQPELGEVPIKLWVRYMPDTAEQLMRSIYVKDELFFDTMPE